MTSEPDGHRHVVNPDSLYDPSAFGYSHGVLVGNHLEIAGQVSFADGIEAQAEEAFAAVARVVESAGGTIDDIVKVTVFTTEADCWERTSEARRRYLPEPPPAATMVRVVGLADPRILLEVEARAVIRSRSAAT